MGNTLFAYNLALITSILLLIFSLFLFIQRKKRKLSGILLALFLSSNAFYLLDFALPLIEDLVKTKWAWMHIFGFGCGYLFGPFIYLFTRSISRRDYDFSLGQTGHFLPFILSIVFISGWIDLPWQLQFTLLNVQIFSYLILSIRLIIRYHEHIKDQFSYIEKINLTWLFYVVGGFMLMWLLDVINMFLSIYKDPAILNTYLTLFSVLINFIFALLIFYKALQQPRFILDLKSLKYEGSRLSPEERENTWQR